MVRKEAETSERIDMIDRVQTIARRLTDVANRTSVTVLWGDSRLNPFTYEFTVLKGDDVNAFSLPGGFIFVYEGLIEFAETDDELAGVLAHEISHASFRHIATLRREQSKFQIVSIPLILAAILAGGSEGIGVAQGANLLNQAVTSGWSVKAEESADYGAIQYMVAAQYNPVGVLTFMERLAFRDRGAPKIDWGIYQTHPPSADRAKALMDRLTARGIAVRRSQVTTSLRADVLPGEEGTVALWFGKTRLFDFGGPEALTRADAAADAVNRFFDSVPGLYEAQLADGTKLRGAGVTLFEVTSDDGPEPEALAKDALTKLKKLIFDLNYRLWPRHDRAVEDR
jgi:beta-barrel assembly-enhancing protease